MLPILVITFRDMKEGMVIDSDDISNARHGTYLSLVQTPVPGTSTPRRFGDATKMVDWVNSRQFLRSSALARLRAILAHI